MANIRAVSIAVRPRASASRDRLRFHRRRALAGAGFFLALASLLVRFSSQEAGRFSDSSSLSATDVRIPHSSGL